MGVHGIAFTAEGFLEAVFVLSAEIAFFSVEEVDLLKFSLFDVFVKMFHGWGSFCLGALDVWSMWNCSVPVSIFTLDGGGCQGFLGGECVVYSYKGYWLPSAADAGYLAH